MGSEGDQLTLGGDAALTALLIAQGALARTESRGAHWRSDFPSQGPARHSETTLGALERAVADTVPAAEALR